MHGVHGPVSAMIATEDKFVTAIDTALGASASSIVVDTSADGKRCIEYLKRTDGGRATFLPIDTIRPNTLRETGLETQKGCFGTADRLVTLTKRYAAIVQNLLARTVVPKIWTPRLRSPGRTATASASSRWTARFCRPAAR